MVVNLFFDWQRYGAVFYTCLISKTSKRSSPRVCSCVGSQREARQDYQGYKRSSIYDGLLSYKEVYAVWVYIRLMYTVCVCCHGVHCVGVNCLCVHCVHVYPSVYADIHKRCVYTYMHLCTSTYSCVHRLACVYTLWMHTTMTDVYTPMHGCTQH